MLLSDNVKDMEHSHNQPDSPAAAPIGAPIADTEPNAAVSKANSIRQGLAELSPHLARYAEASAACSCSSVCPTCVGVVTAGIVMPLVFRKRDKE